MSTFLLQKEPIDTAALRQRVADPDCGGYASFEGWIRNENEGRAVSRLEYEAYAPLAIAEAHRIVNEALKRFEINNALSAHRLGALDVGDLAVWVGVSAPHRADAFAACRYIIDEIKQRLPIWKKEHYADGKAQWVNCAQCASQASLV
ncbi:MAG: molybdenum cofactor biosynthesis protein MoaE [Gammaproteobacteria bacterium]|nr:molybdenum cofactor biosynthesis protein MoaE [Gammaproteobacteria bacterium]